METHEFTGAIQVMIFAVGLCLTASGMATGIVIIATCIPVGILGFLASVFE